MDLRDPSSVEATIRPSTRTYTLKASKPTLLLHPLIVFSAVWLGVVFLYSLQLSYILRYSTVDALAIVLRIWLPFAATSVVYTLIHRLSLAAYPTTDKRLCFNNNLLRDKLDASFKFWLIGTAAEVIISGGVPIIWALTGSAKTYTDFGIPSVHGFMNSLQTAISVCYFALFLITRERRALKTPVFFLCWTMIIINRNMMLVTLLEFAVVYVRLRRLRLHTLVQIIAGTIVFVFAFGMIGDIRQGTNGLIRDLAQPTEDYPDWLPSGVLWVYIYITTPINNLIYTLEVKRPENNLLFPSTVSTLFPSVLRTAIYGNSLGDAESGSLVNSAFNVSTAYVGPYQDFGWTGIALFSVCTAFSTLFFWFRDDLRSILMFAVVTQCLVLTLFFDHFFYLPVITQLGWLLYLFSTHQVSSFAPHGWRRSGLAKIL